MKQWTFCMYCRGLSPNAVSFEHVLGLETWKFVGSQYRDKAHDDITISWCRVTPVCSMLPAAATLCAHAMRTDVGQPVGAAAKCGWTVGWIQHCCLLSPVPPPPHPACSV